MNTLFLIETDQILMKWSLAKLKKPIPMAQTHIPGRLHLRLRRGSLVFEKIVRSFPNGEAGFTPEVTVGPHLYEQTDYKIFIQSKTDRTISLLHRDPVICRDISSEDNGRISQGYINFGSQIGHSEFTVMVDNQPEFDFEVEVFPSKLDYLTDYEQMLAEVQEILTGLAMEYLRSTFHLGQVVSVPEPSHIEWLVLLRHVADDLELAAHQVSHRPVRGLVREPRKMRTEKVKRVDSSVRSSVLRGRGTGALYDLGQGLAVREKLTESHARPTLETPEHRWIAAQLRSISRRIGLIRLQEAEKPSSPRRKQVLKELDALEARILRLRHLEPFTCTGEPPSAGFSSLQLLIAPGYREVYRCCLVLLLGLRIEGGPVHLSVKDLNLLYEYWCYLALLRLLSDVTGQPIPVQEFFSIEQQGLQVRLKKGKQSSVCFDQAGARKITCTYNPCFQNDSILIPQQPDMVITLESPGWQKLHLILDAKYRIDMTPEYLRRYSSPGPPEDALNVMHRYRDAILEREGQGFQLDSPKRTVVQAAAVFPYRETEHGLYRHSLLWRSLDQIGVGALPILPGSTGYVREWLYSTLHRGGWALADRAIEHRAREGARNWREAAAETVLVGVLRSEDELKHLEWIKTQHIYYTPLLKTQKRQFAVKWLALYNSKTRSGLGGVTHYAPVIGTEVVERKSIITPWQTKRGEELLQVLYYLGDFIPLPKPVLNKDKSGKGQRFSSHRWTSRLSLCRALVITELLLETEPEWRLYEDLNAAGVAFQLVPEKVTLPDRDNPSGRVWFVTDRGVRIRYAGASGFLVKDNGGTNRFFLRVNEVIALIEKV